MENNKRSGKRKPRNFKGKGRDKEIEVNVKDADINKADLKGAENDYTWYTKYPTLFKNVTGINFGNQVGAPFRWNPSLVGQDGNLYPYTAAGVCGIHFIPTLGAANSTLDTPAARVAAQMYSAMRMKLGSTASYDATDIMLYMGAMDSAYVLYAMGAKIYGMLRYASPFNYYFLERMCTANNVDYSSFADNLANFRSKLNQFAIFLSSRLVPASFDILKRHVWMATNMFTDSETAKAQIYTMVPDGYYVYTEVTAGPGYLKFMPFNYATDASALLTFQMWTAALNNVYESLMGSSDIDQMSADIGKAFEGATFTLALIPEDYITPITYSKEVLSQIENCVLSGGYKARTVNEGDLEYGSFDIYQSVGLPKSPRLVQRAYTTAGLTTSSPAGLVNSIRSILLAKKLINFHWMNPTQEDIIVATRGIPGAITLTTDNTSYGISGYGSEVYTMAVLWDLDADLEMTPTTYTYANQTSSGSNAQLMCKWVQFDWAPTFWLVNYDASPYNAKFMADIDNYALVDWIQLADMNTNAVLSEFYSDKFPQVLE